MKAKYFTSMFILVLLSVCLIFSGERVSALANSAAPIRTETGQGIVFKQHESVQIQSEILDIVINDEFDVKAKITATYVMKNTSEEALSIETLFITPIEYGENKDISVERNDNVLDFTEEYYSPYYSDYDAQNIEDWENILAEARNSEQPAGNEYIAAIVYFVDFAPGEEVELKVSYLYQMGTSGYRATADLLYYLSPAKYWKDFSGIEINLTLSEKYKKLESSSLEFKKIDDKNYKFESDTLPDSELRIKVSNGSILAACGCGTLQKNSITIIGLFIVSSFAVFAVFKKRVRKTSPA